MYNCWDEKVVNKLEKDWGKKLNHTYDTFSLASTYGDSFLDIGCGYGRFFDYLLKKRNSSKLRYTGLDSSVAMIEKAKKEYFTARADFIEWNIEKSFKLSADVILCNEVFIHIPLERQAKILNNINNCKSKYVIVTIESNSEGITSVRAVNLEGQQFYVVIQNEYEFEASIRKYILDVKSIKKLSFFLIGDISKIVFIVERK